jgi:hypothetical protein
MTSPSAAATTCLIASNAASSGGATIVVVGEASDGMMSIKVVVGATVELGESVWYVPIRSKR